MSNNISKPTQKLISRYQDWYQSLQLSPGISTIHVDEVASRVASFYEKIKGIIDWREEHLLRKAAIERILKRRLFLRKNSEKIAAPFIHELIRGGHFPNDAIPESKIEEIQKLIDKYIFILENAPSPPKEKLKARLYDWILGLAACEVEEVLSPPLRERALIDYMTEIMKERIEVREGIFVIGGMTEEEKNTQIYIAVHRALFKLDPPIISYGLLKKRYRGWLKLTPPDPLLKEIANNIYSIWQNIEKDLRHPLAEKFYRVCERYDTPYLILGDIVSEDPLKAPKILENPEVLENSIGKAYYRRLKQTKSKVRRAAIYSTVSIFLTKMLLAFAIAFAIEIPTGAFRWFTFGIDITIPPLLMFLLVLSIRPPSKTNFQKVIMEVTKIVYERERKEVYEVKTPPKRGFILNAAITIFYLLTFCVSFGLIIWGFQKLHFGILSQIIFIIFICLISFAGVKIRERAKELVVEEEKGGFLSFLLDTFSLPFIRMGRWLSGQWAKYNFFVVLLNSLIDMPFQIFVEFIEQWRAFLKEKKEEIH